MSLPRFVLMAGLALGLAGCDEDRTRRRGQALEAFCEATVETAAGTVVVDVETDYLPRVVSCENGAADQAALEAQAVAARSYLYYRLARTGMIGDGTGDQVYTCSRPPGPAHYQAVLDTSGLVLRYPPGAADDGTQVAAFYVAGALQDGPSCRGGITDPTTTEHWVTYNEGLSGADITQTMLGFVDPGNDANRGCMSQNGADCLAEEGRDVTEILRFYYGADIAIVRAGGACIDPIEPPVDPDAGPGGDDPIEEVGCSATGDGSVAALAVLSTALLLLRDPRRRRRASRRRAKKGRRSR